MFDFLSSWFNSNLVTDVGKKTARLKTDAQPTSYEANEQFKIFHRILAVPHTSQIVMKFTSINAVNIMVRSINIWKGGREYLVYGEDGSHTVTGSFSPITTRQVNSNVSGGGTHPVSGVTVEIATGAGVFTAGSLPSNGDLVMTDSNANRANGQAHADSNKSGIAAGSVFYLVFNHIGQNSVTNGQFYLQWEERFGE